MGESGETPKPKSHELKGRAGEQPQGNILVRAPAVALALLGLAAGGAYATQHEDPGIGGFLSQNEPRNEKVTTGQLFADSQLASVDSLPGVEKETYQKRLDLAEKEMSSNITAVVKDRIKTYGPLIIDAANEAGVPQDLLLGQAIAESKCDPEAGSRVGAAGIFQIRPFIYNDEERGIDPFNVKESAELTSEILTEEYAKFGDWSLSFWSWHIGAPRVYEAVRIYAYNLKKKVILEDVDVKPENGTPEAYEKATLIATERIQRYKDFIKEYKISVDKLYESGPVRELYTGEEWDRTWDYWARIVKSAEIVESQNLVQVAQQ